MRIALDIRPFLSRSTGVGVLFRQLLLHLGEIDSRNEYLLFSSSLKERADRQPFARFPNFQVRDFRVPVRLLNFSWHNLRLPAVESFLGPLDVAHSPHPLLLPCRAAKKVVTIHDLYFLTHPREVAGEVRRDYPRLVRRSAAEADLVQTISRFTARAIVEQLGVEEGKIRIVGPGVEPPAGVENGGGSRPGPSGRAPLPAGLSRGGYLLAVGTLEPRKNLPALFEALACWKRQAAGGRVPLLAVAGGGRPEEAARHRRLAAALGLEQEVRFLGYVEQERLGSLYEGAIALAVPSALEGFCLPLLEAMSRGTPVVAAASGAIPEVAGDAALLVEPGDTEGLAAALARLDGDPDLRSELARRGRERCREFSWRRSAERLLALYEELGPGS